MASLPISFHVGPFTFYVYGFGLAVAGLVGYHYVARRLRTRGLDVSAWPRVALWSLLGGLLGARALHVVTNLGYYQQHLGSIVAVWQGGLASFGGLLVAVPIGVIVARRSWPTASLRALADAVVPALIAAWAVGRVLGPQFMYAGGGHLTHQWFGLPYVGQSGRRVPVPLLQGAEDALTWIGLLWAERRPRRPGTVAGFGMLIWGTVRALDEHFWLGESGRLGSLGVQLAGATLALLGIWLIVRPPRPVLNQPHA